MRLLILLTLLTASMATTHLIALETNTNRVALVFDDGPFAEHAPKLLELFAKEKIHVTFSLVANRVQTNSETAKAIAKAGHEIANHSYSHLHAKTCDDATLERVLKRARDLMRRNLKGPRRTTFGTFASSPFFVYERSGQHCLKCDTKIGMRRQGALQRSTYFCPECQGVA